MRANPHMRQVNQDWGERAPTLHFVLDQDRLRLIGLTPTDVGEQLQFLLTRRAPSRRSARTSAPSMSCARERGPRAARSRPARRLHPDQPRRAADPARARSARSRYALEDPILKRRDRMPDDHRAERHRREPAAARGLDRDRRGAAAAHRRAARRATASRSGGSIEEAGKANAALAPIFPIMIAADAARHHPPGPLASRRWRWCSLTAPLGLVGAVPTLLLFDQPFGFNAILGLIGLAGILMRNTLILIGQIHTTRRQGLNAYRRGGRSDRPARAAGDPDGAGRGARLHSADHSRSSGDRWPTR